MNRGRTAGLLLLVVAAHLAPCLQICAPRACTGPARQLVCVDPPHSAQRAALFQPLRLRGGRSTALGQRLQNLHYVMKKDPQGYLPEVKGHLDAWRAAVSAWERKPELPHQELGELSVFLGSTMGKFPALLGDFGPQLLALLATQATGSNSTATMCSDLRLAVAKAVAIANSRKSISVPALCGVFFGLFHLPDKRLRAYAYMTCLSAMKRLNANSVDLGINRELQRPLAAFLHGSDTRSGRAAISIMIEMYRRGMWEDAHMVNLIAAACFSRQSAVRVAALHFFLGIDDSMQHDEEEDADDFGLHRNNAAAAGELVRRIKMHVFTHILMHRLTLFLSLFLRPSLPPSLFGARAREGRQAEAPHQDRAGHHISQQAQEKGAAAGFW